MYPYQFGNWADKTFQPFFFILKKKKYIICSSLLNNLFEAFSQELDVDELLERLDRIEKNISDLQREDLAK